MTTTGAARPTGTTGTRGTTAVLDALRHFSLHPVVAERAVHEGTAERSWERVSAPGDDVEVWLVSWPAGSGTGWHEHRQVRGAFTTLRGRLTEYTWDGVVHARTLPEGGGRAFGEGFVHDLVNQDRTWTLSLHAYSPELRGLTRYELVRGRLEAVSHDGQPEDGLL